MRPRIPLVVFLLGALAGIMFSTISAGDFAQHLDRQVHSIHCSILPGGAADVSGTSGCHVALMSPYSSFFTGLVWGGIPVALPGIALFAFFVYRGVALWLGGRQSDPTAVKFLVGISVVPLITSVVFGGIAVVELDALCKTCMGIYLSSLVCFGASLAMLWQFRRPRYALDDDDLPEDPDGSVDEVAPLDPIRHHLTGLAESGVFVALPLIAYVALAPDHGVYAGKCGQLFEVEDPYAVMVPIGQQTSGAEAIEVFDPLCPACAGSDQLSLLRELCGFTDISAPPLLCAAAGHAPCKAGRHRNYPARCASPGVA